MQVAEKYHGQKDATAYLVDKIINGGGGVWGEVAMAAHPGMKEGEARQIVQWVMSLAENASARQKSLPAKGVVVAKKPDAQAEETVLRFHAQYTNVPGMGIRPLPGSKTVDLKLEPKSD